VADNDDDDDYITAEIRDGDEKHEGNNYYMPNLILK
jgi:hypothetical protein